MVEECALKMQLSVLARLEADSAAKLLPIVDVLCTERLPRDFLHGPSRGVRAAQRKQLPPWSPRRTTWLEAASGLPLSPLR
eukprot:7429568-Lingulodinium_polyedra.AAC.1